MVADYSRSTRHQSLSQALGATTRGSGRHSAATMLDAPAVRMSDQLGNMYLGDVKLPGQSWGVADSYDFSGVPGMPAPATDYQQPASEFASNHNNFFQSVADVVQEAPQASTFAVRVDLSDGLNELRSLPSNTPDHSPRLMSEYPFEVVDVTAAYEMPHHRGVPEVPPEPASDSAVASQAVPAPVVSYRPDQRTQTSAQLPSRRQTRQIRDNARRRRTNRPSAMLAKSGVLAATVIGVVAANTPNLLNSSLFGGPDKALTALPASDTLAQGQSAKSADGAKPNSAVDGALKDRLAKNAAQRQRVSQAAGNAGPGILAAAQAQVKYEKAQEQAQERKAAAARVKVLDAQAAKARTSSGAKAAAKDMVKARGWSNDQYTCLVSLWNKESGWRYTARNPSSGATGIPQALPGSKMASAGSDWRTNPITQMEWGLDYIEDRYNTPCGAWSHSKSTGWY